ncbi:MAG: hypothetical protein U0M02_13605 [Acutalibacteraceae bacterium]|nr:hypothetical protein [Acutalibacteraceae bacterium]
MSEERITPLLERTFIFLEDEEWQKADEYCEKVLDIDPQNIKAYLGKLMAEFKIKKLDDFNDCKIILENSNNYQKVISFGDEELVSFLKNVNESIKNRTNIKNQKKKQVVKKVLAIGVPVIAVCVALIVIVKTVVIPMVKYNKAIELADSGEYWQAISAFNEIEDYKDSKAIRFALWDNIAERNTISAANFHMVCVRSDGTVAAYGENDDGECRVNAWKDVIAVSAGGDYTYGLQKNGQVLVTAQKTKPHIWGYDNNHVAISAGWNHVVALRANGTVVANGENNCGQTNIMDFTDIVAISAGCHHTVGLKSDGTVVATKYIDSPERSNDDYSGQCEVYGWRDIAAVAAGYDHTVGLKTDGTVVAVGSNEYGKCNVGEWTDIVAVAVGSHHTVGLKADGTVIYAGWHEGVDGVKDWSDIVAVSACQFNTIGLKSDGTIVAVGSNTYKKLNIIGENNVKLPNNMKQN